MDFRIASWYLYSSYCNNVMMERRMMLNLAEYNLWIWFQFVRTYLHQQFLRTKFLITFQAHCISIVFLYYFLRFFPTMLITLYLWRLIVGQTPIYIYTLGNDCLHKSVFIYRESLSNKIYISLWANIIHVKTRTTHIPFRSLCQQF